MNVLPAPSLTRLPTDDLQQRRVPPTSEISPEMTLTQRKSVPVQQDGDVITGTLDETSPPSSCITSKSKSLPESQTQSHKSCSESSPTTQSLHSNYNPADPARCGSYQDGESKEISKRTSCNNEHITTCQWMSQKCRQYARYMNRRAKPGHAYMPTDEEHLANTFTHGLLVIPSVLAMWWMLHIAHDPLQYGIAMIYGVALFVLFGVSTTFHALSYMHCPIQGKFMTLKNFFHIGDRAVIYIFIAASYTPWLLLKDYSHHSWGTFMLGVVWIAAVLGIIYQYTFHEQYKWLETLFYLIIGVCPSVVCLAMTDTSGQFELAFGGSIYISGVIFFKCDGLIPFAHAIWHCFVTLGAVCHYQAVCTYLLGPHNTVSA